MTQDSHLLPAAAVPSTTLTATSLDLDAFREWMEVSLRWTIDVVAWCERLQGLGTLPIWGAPWVSGDEWPWQWQTLPRAWMDAMFAAASAVMAPAPGR